MNINELNQSGLKDMLRAIQECRVPLAVRTRDAEARAALAESEANSLRKLAGFLNVMDVTLRTRLEELIEFEAKNQ